MFDGTKLFTYDAENRLVQAGSVQLVYDSNGRLWQTSGGPFGNTQFVYDGDDLVIEYDGDTQGMRRRYMHGPGVDEVVLWDEGGAMNCSGTRVLHPDAQGSVIAVADCYGNRIAGRSLGSAKPRPLSRTCSTPWLSPAHLGYAASPRTTI